MQNLNSEELLNRKMPKSIISWITILVILLIIVLIFINIPFNIYKSFNGYIFKYNKEFYVKVLLNKSDFPINKRNALYIKNKKYNYEVVNIDKKEYILDLKLEDSIKIDNNIVRVNIKKEKTTVFNMLKKIIKKGFDL